MEGKARFIFPAILSCVMAFLMTAVVTYLNVGLPSDFIAAGCGPLSLPGRWPISRR